MNFPLLPHTKTYYQMIEKTSQNYHPCFCHHKLEDDRISAISFLPVIAGFSEKLTHTGVVTIENVYRTSINDSRKGGGGITLSPESATLFVKTKNPNCPGVQLQTETAEKFTHVLSTGSGDFHVSVSSSHI